MEVYASMLRRPLAWNSLLVGGAAVVWLTIHSQLAAQQVQPTPAPDAIAELAERFSVLETEIARLESQGEVDAAQLLRNQLEFARALHRGEFPAPQSRPLELHAVSMRKGGERFADAPPVAIQRKLRSAEIAVTHTAAPIILFVSAGEDLHLKFAIAPQAQVLAVVFGGVHHHVTTGLPSDAFVYYAGPGPQELGNIVWPKDRESVDRLLKALRIYFQREPMTLTATNLYLLKPVVVGPENETWRAQYALSQTGEAYQQLLDDRRRDTAAKLALRFQGTHYDFGNRNHFAASGEFTLAGPEMRTLRPIHRHIGQLIAINGGRHHYALTGSAFLRFDPATGAGAPVPQINHAPQDMAFGAVAYDTKRERFVLTGMNPPHPTYTFTPGKQAWETLNPQGPSLAALTYLPRDDQFLGVTSEHEFLEHPRTNAFVVRLNPDGQLVESFPLRRDVWPTRSQWGGTTLAKTEEKLIIAVPPEEDERGEHHSHIYAVDLRTHEVAYSGVSEIHEGDQVFRAFPRAREAHWGRSIRRLFDQLEIAEEFVQQLRREDRLPEADRLESQIGKLRDRLSGTARVTEQSEPRVHVVSNLATKVVTIEVTTVSEPAILFLCSREPVKWRIRVAPGALLQRVILGSTEREMIEEIPAGVMIDTYPRNPGDKGFFVSRDDAITYQIVSDLTQEKTGRSPWTVHRIEQPDTATLTLGPANGDWTLQCVLAELDQLLTGPLAERQARALASLNGIVFRSVYRTSDMTHSGEFAERFRFGTFTARGVSPQQLSELPAGFTGLVVDDVTGDRYGLREHQLMKISGATGDITPISSQEALPDVPTFSHITYDARNRRLLLSNEQLYAYDLATKRWSTPIGIDLQTRHLTHSATHDLLCGISTMPSDDALSLHLFNMSGALIGAYRLPGTAHPNGYASSLPQMTVVCSDDLVAIIGPLVRDPHVRSRLIPEIRVFDLRTLSIVYAGLLPLRPATNALSRERVQQLWELLASDDAAIADTAIWELASGDRETVDFVTENLTEVQPLAESQARKLIAELESDLFETRRAALERLEKQGRSIRPLLREFADHPSAEVRASIQRLLRAANAELPQVPELAREVRAMHVLELIATPEAVQALQEAASGPPDLERTVAAKAALKRMSAPARADE